MLADELNSAALRNAAERAAAMVRAEQSHEVRNSLRPFRRFLADDRCRDHIGIALLFALESAGIPESQAREVKAWLLRDDSGPMPAYRFEPPEIQVVAHTLPEQIDQAEAAVIGARTGLYQRGSSVVQIAPARVGPLDTDGAGCVVAEVNDRRLVELFTRSARWNRWDARSRQHTPVACPLAVAQGYLARAGVDWNLPPLRGVINAPTLRADGSTLDVAGYDPRTGMFLDNRGTHFPEIPLEPSRADADAALASLLDLLAEFPFTTAAAEAVAVSAIVTAIVRPGLPTAPAHAVSATVFGSGKSFLCDLISVIATGRIVAPIACGKTDEELEKRLGAALIAGKPLITIDNVNREINGALLAQMITQTRIAPRRLGFSENVEVDNAAMLLLNGNNLALPADLSRRVVLCSLAAKEERPELRQFYMDPVEVVSEGRGVYVAAALTIIRAYISAGMPDRPRRIGGFHRWSDLVRGALIWVGLDDPCATMETVRELDPERQRLTAVMAQWDDVLGCRRVTVREIIDAAIAQAGGEFRESLLTVAGDGRGAINGSRLGAWLRDHKSRINGTFRFESGPQRRGNATWVLHGGRDVPADESGVRADDVAALLR